MTALSPFLQKAGKVWNEICSLEERTLAIYKLQSRETLKKEKKVGEVEGVCFLRGLAGALWVGIGCQMEIQMKWKVKWKFA